MNSKNDLKNLIKNNIEKKIFIITGKKSYKESGAQTFFEEFLNKNKTKIYFKQNNIPILEELVVLINEVRSYKPDLLLAIGGGSVIDYAKIANVVEIKNNLKDLILNYDYRFQKKYTKLIVVPTTAGSGAEVTSNAVIYVDNIKYSFESELLIPDEYFLINDFVTSSPFKIKASAGFDAIAQATESLISKKSNNNSIEFGIKSLEISLEYFNSYLVEPNELNSIKMLTASNLAGKAINISKTTAPHATSYPFTSLFGISHGHAVSLFFDNFLMFNFENSHKSQKIFDIGPRYEMLFKIYKVKNIFEFTQKIKKIKKYSNLEDNLDMLNIDLKDNMQKILDGINILRLKNNPVDLEREDIVKIINKK